MSCFYDFNNLHWSMGSKENIIKLWSTHVSIFVKSNYGKGAELFYHGDEPLEQRKDFIIRSINEHLEHKNVKTPITRTYSSKGMTEFQKLIFLIEETERVLFSKENRFMCSIIYDEYNINHGTQGLYEIIGHYINWIDTNN